MPVAISQKREAKKVQLKIQQKIDGSHPGGGGAAKLLITG